MGLHTKRCNDGKFLKNSQQWDNEKPEANLHQQTIPILLLFTNSCIAHTHCKYQYQIGINLFLTLPFRIFFDDNSNRIYDGSKLI